MNINEKIKKRKQKEAGSKMNFKISKLKNVKSNIMKIKNAKLKTVKHLYRPT